MKLDSIPANRLPLGLLGLLEQKSLETSPSTSDVAAHVCTAFPGKRKKQPSYDEHFSVNGKMEFPNCNVSVVITLYVGGDPAPSPR
jgi:hypothetical protein|tara:strand:- start:1052 stop:1309 length:258 start_codon:yes stop_codon:yes gene_type:complete